MQTESSGWTNVNTGSASQQDGDYAVLFASTAFLARWMVISWTDAPTLSNATISIGPFTNPGFPNPGTAAGADIFSGLRLVGSSQGMGPNPMSFPVNIPQGTELGWQVRANNTSSTVRMIVTLSDTPLGLDATQSQSSGYIGTPPASISIPAANDTDSPIVEAIASTNFAANWLVLSCEFDHTTANNNVRLKIDVLQGAVGFEVPVNPDFGQTFFQSTNRTNNSRYLCMPIDVPAGTRLSVRGQMLDSGVGSPHAETVQLGLTIFG